MLKLSVVGVQGFWVGAAFGAFGAEGLGYLDITQELLLHVCTAYRHMHVDPKP